MHPLYVKQQAVKLRRKGYTYTDINEVLDLNISKSTLSGWFKDITLSKSSLINLEKNIARKLKESQEKGLKTILEKRERYLCKILNKNMKYAKQLNLPVQKIILSILYLGEGAKYRSSRILRLGSSDPEIVKFYINLLHNCYAIDTQRLKARIQCRYDQNPLRLVKFWKEALNIPHLKFGPTYVDKRTRDKPTLRKNYKGVCTLEYCSTEIQLDLEILANYLMTVIDGKVIKNSTFVSKWIRPKINDRIN